MIRIVSLVAFVICSALQHTALPAAGQSVPLRQPDGTQGLMSPLGANGAIYSDAHGNKQPITPQSGLLLPPGTERPPGTLPGARTPFGTPAPPNLLTPAPVLPLSPKSMVTPQPQAPGSAGVPGRSATPDGRPGR